MGIIITIGVLLVCSNTSALTINIIGKNTLLNQSDLGITKDILLTYLGFIFFPDAHLNSMVLFGLTLSFAGASIYGAD